MRTPEEKLMNNVFLIIIFLIFISTAIISPFPFVQIVGVKIIMPFCSYENNIIEFLGLEIPSTKENNVLVATISLTLFVLSSVIAHKSLLEVYHPSVGVVEKSKG